ncbi:MAG: tetratricopeptide repeat protein [Lentisphaeria bacterium]|nr:tetratricopeptide repeat protein [Lentisphaeria bacterium]
MNFLRSFQRLFRSLAPASVVMALASFPVLALDEFSYDLRLIRALAENNMPDYAMNQVDRMVKLYPEKKDVILLQKALVFYAQSKRSKAEEIIAGIPKGSPLYGQSRLIMAREAFKRGAFADAADGFAAYFSTNPTPASEEKPDVDDFHESVMMFARANVELGNPDGAAKALTNAAVVKGDHAYPPDVLAYQKGKHALAAGEKALDLGLPVTSKSIEDETKKLEDLQFKQIPYLLMTNALIEAARGKVLLGDLACETADGSKKKAQLAKAIAHYKDAFTGLKGLSEFVAGFDKELPPSESPAAGTLFYFGRIRKGQARVALLNGDKQQAVEKLKQAREKFDDVKTKYGDSPYGVSALVEDGKIIDILTKLGENVDNGSDSEGGALVKITQADKYYSANDFEKAAPLFLDALRMARTSPRFGPPTGLKLVVCYTSMPGKMLEAQAVASFLADVFPDAEETANALLQLGFVTFQKAKQMTDGPEKQALMDEAMVSWNKFVDIAPDDPKAADLAFMVAENAYVKADAAAGRTNTIKDRQKKEAAKQEARDLFRSAIAKYERVTSAYGGTPKGVRAYFRMGVIFDTLDQPQDAAEAFLTYAKRENLNENAEDRLDAQFQGASQLLFSDTPAAAIAPLRELLAWVSPDNTQGFDPGSEKVLDVRENATSYEAWAYDLSAEAIRPEITDNKDQQAAQKDIINEASTNLKRLATQEKELNDWRAAVRKEIEDVSVDFKNPLPRPEEKALKEFLPDAEVSQWTDAERAVELPRRKASAARLAADYLNQDLQSMKGLMDSFASSKNKAFTTLQMNQKDLAETVIRISDLERQLIGMKDELDYSQDELDKLTTRHDLAVEAAAEATARLADLRKRYEAARLAFKTGDDEAKAAAREEGREVRALIPGAEARLMEATRAKEGLESDEAELTRRRAARAKDTNAAKVALIERQLSAARRQQALLSADIAFNEAHVQALGQAIKAGEVFIALMKKPEAERYGEENLKAWRTAADSALDLFAKESAAADEKVKVAEGYIAADRQAYIAATAEAQKTIADLENEIKPVQAKFNDLKRQAQQAFTSFLKAYPKSKHVPDNMARVGTIFIEFNQYEQAENYLNKLAETYPDHAAVKQAMFSLGKVQFEIGKIDEAATAFTKVLATADAQATPNLKYIVKATMDTAHAELGLRASRELLTRGADANHPDYDKLSGKYRESILFRAGLCAMGAKQYTAARDYFDTLLKENEKTARFYDANILKARACRLMTPPDPMAARKALGQVMRFTQDSAVLNETLVEQALVYLLDESREGASSALGPLGQIILVMNGEAVVLADDKDPASRDFIDQGFYLAAKCYALLGDSQSRDLVVAEYRKRFPNGAFAEAMSQLPDAL